MDVKCGVWARTIHNEQANMTAECRRSKMRQRAQLEVILNQRTSTPYSNPYSRIQADPMIRPSVFCSPEPAANSEPASTASAHLRHGFGLPRSSSMPSTRPWTQLDSSSNRSPARSPNRSPSRNQSLAPSHRDGASSLPVRRPPPSNMRYSQLLPPREPLLTPTAHAPHHLASPPSLPLPLFLLP